MYEALKGVVLAVLKLPSEPPEEPAGTHESVQVFRASPRYLTYLLLQWGVVMGLVAAGTLVGATAAAIGLSGTRWGWVVAAIEIATVVLLAAKFALTYVTTRLNYELRWYIVTDRSLRIREGVFLLREVTLTFANVQNLNVTQGPLQRYFGISDLIVETAGGGSGMPHGQEGLALAHHGVMRGIENAAEVREKIQALLRQYRKTGLGDPEERKEEGTGWGAAEMEALRALRDETAQLRSTVCPRE